MFFTFWDHDDNKHANNEGTPFINNQIFFAASVPWETGDSPWTEPTNLPDQS
jgi:hypothetical protein